jgi:hypothetical protein
LEAGQVLQQQQESKKMRNNRRNNNKPLEPCVTVRAEDNHGDPERMIRRFRKMVKAERGHHRRSTQPTLLQGTQRETQGRKRRKTKTDQQGE